MLSNKGQILVVDDDSDDIQLFCEAMEEIAPGITCSSADNGVEALRLMQKSERIPDIIFLDINMPVMNGWAFLQKVKSIEAYRNIPVVMYSTSSEDDDLKRALSLGAYGLVTKPEKFSELIKTLEKVLADTNIDVAKR
jgi:CheY-like chemotaxis protein